MPATAQQGNFQKQWGMLVARAWSDDALKQRLMEEPATVMREEGIEVPYDVEVQVLVDTERVRHLILPPSPDGDLVDEELTVAVGRACYSWACGRCHCGCGRCGCGCDASE